jgi:hypothetical protein
MASDNETAEDYWRTLSEYQEKEIERLRAELAKYTDQPSAGLRQPSLTINPDGSATLED